MPSPTTRSSPSLRSCCTNRRRGGGARRLRTRRSTSRASIASWCASRAAAPPRRPENVVRAPRAERLAIAGPAGKLEALIETPVSEGSAGGDVSAFGVVCHPHPLYGGTLDNKVVHTLARAFEERGAPTIRFNFRGVGESAGSYDEGRGETEDALAVIAFGRARWPQAALWLGGFSFRGAAAGLAAAGGRPPRRGALG